MIDLSQNIATAQIAFALMVIAFVVVWKFGGKRSSRKSRK